VRKELADLLDVGELEEADLQLDERGKAAGRDRTCEKVDRLIFPEEERSQALADARRRRCGTQAHQVLVARLGRHDAELETETAPGDDILQCPG